ncbi:MAG: cyclic pyranopterin phosphate synthase MoaA [Candidatus Melainabacteria bacterium RIFCSPLOWO2_02_FULL_35_15]|nr:MAG: cyclic pyranopterin phosphate synthase MoaA [Candidatus Melainabacteria bacterium RIFCSPLOWO2_12_FULL_35_11]OGI13881.1 MAG: cyclic pyranopterin phosphate synthase MoaA [Candidatus Melainabacteria bacterium RIFCSPLOWO2_02_FULL_35_15]
MNKLVDRFGRVHTYLRISVTDRCNLRCVYCMPMEGVKWKDREEILTFEEILKVAKIFVSMGISKIRITGGEPTIRKDIEKLIAKLAELPGLKTLAMTTNGITLKDHAASLKKAGLSALNISLDTLQQKRYMEIAKRDYLNNVLIGIGSALALGFHPLKLNVVVINGVNDDEILDFVNFIKDKPINIRFIEFMPFKHNSWDHKKVLSYSKIKEKIQDHYDLIPIKCEPNAVAKDYCIEGFMGSVSFITSMSDSFCSSCNRIRLTANGSIKSCLFKLPEVNLRNALRADKGDEVISNMIEYALSLKEEAHPSTDKLATIENQSMIQIGG